MTPFEQGYVHFLKVAGFVDEFENDRRKAHGELTDRQLQAAGGSVAMGAAFAPTNVDTLLGLQRSPLADATGKGYLARLKSYYTGARIPGLALEDNLVALNRPGGATLGELEDLSSYVEPSAGRAKNVLRRVVKDLPSYARRHPFLTGIGALGLAGTASSAKQLGQGVYERYLGGAKPTVGWGDAAVAGAGLAGVGAIGAGLYEANQRGMLPKVTIEMPQDTP